MKWISLQDLALIHRTVINETGGVHGVMNYGALESSLQRPFSFFEGNEAYPDIWSKLAVFIHSLIVFHPFADGNKRTAFVATDVILKLNGYHIKPAFDHEIFFFAIARGEKSIEEIKHWLKIHSGPIYEHH